MRIFVILFLSICYSLNLFSEESECLGIIHKPKTWKMLEENYKVNKASVVKWIEEFEPNRLAKKDLIFDLIENESPEFVCALAFAFEGISKNSDLSISNEEWMQASIMALTCYQLAGEKGNIPAIVRTSVIFGDLKDHKNAIKWETKGVEAGDSLSMFYRGIRLLVGREFDDITERDAVEGWKWISISSMLGEKNADEALDNGYGFSRYVINLGKSKGRVKWLALFRQKINKIL